MSVKWPEPPARKVCGICQRELPASSDYFDKDGAKADGFKAACKACRKERRELKKAKQASKLLETLDQSIVANLAQMKPGGSSVPHAAEVCQTIMALLGGVQGFAMHWAGTFAASPPGSATRERMLASMVKLTEALSDSNKVSMPTELMSDQDLDAELERREKRMRVINAEEVREADSPNGQSDQPAA